MKKSTLYMMFTLMLVLATACGFAFAADATAAAEAPAGASLLEAIVDMLPKSWEVWVTTIISICAVIASVSPAPDEKSNVFVRFLYTIVNAAAWNVGKAKNADDVK